MTSSWLFFGKSILFIVHYLSATFQVNSTSQSKDTLGRPLGAPQHLIALKSPILIDLNTVIFYLYVSICNISGTLKEQINSPNVTCRKKLVKFDT